MLAVLSTMLFFGLHWLIALALSIRVISQQKNSGVSLAWISVLFFVPYAGIVAYWLIGERRMCRTRARRASQLSQYYRDHLAVHEGTAIGRNMPGEPELSAISSLIDYHIGMQAYKGNTLELLASADQVFDRLVCDIENAKDYCLLGFYIVESGGKMKGVIEALCAASQRGVDCRLLADSVGSKGFLDSEWPARLEEHGVQLKAALPVGFFKSTYSRVDLRNHRKIAIFDGEYAYTGSMNLVDPVVFKTESGVGQWVDVMVRCRGPVVQELSAVIYGDWVLESDIDVNELLASVDSSAYKNQLISKSSHDGSIVQAIPSGPGQDIEVIYETFVSVIHMAREQIIITTPYLVIDDAMMLALRNAAHKGVEVILIIPEKVDSTMVKYASRSQYEKLLTAGVKIALYHAGLLHTKSISIDHKFCLLGTANMDMRSFYLNMELTLLIYDKDFIGQLDVLQHSYLDQSRLLELGQWQDRSNYQRAKENVFRLASPLL